MWDFAKLNQTSPWRAENLPAQLDCSYAASSEWVIDESGWIEVDS